MIRKATAAASPSYGPFQSAWLGICLVLTRLFFRHCRFIRFPIFLRGRSKIRFGKRLTTGYLVRLDALGDDGCLEFGNDVELNDLVHIGAKFKIRIGNDVLIASRVFITDHDHGIYSSEDAEESSSPMLTPNMRPVVGRPVDIGDRVWIGENVSILAGVTIGSGSIIGAGAVVRTDIPANCIAVGVPARVVRRFDFEKKIWIPVVGPA